jgi:hypothetical protein
MTAAEYLESLAQTAGLDDESKAGLKKALGNAKFVEEVGKGIKRQDEFSRGMDDLRTEKQKVEQQISQWRDWYNTAVTNDAAREEELVALRAKAGTPTGTPTVTPTATGLTKKELEEREGRMISIVKQGMRLASRHAAKFGEELDTEALEKLAVEKGLTLDRAYEELVRPRVEAAAKADFDAKLKEAHEQGLREGLSKRDLPGEGAKSFHPIFGHTKQVEDTKGMTDGQRASNFAEAWNKETVKK